MNRLAAGNLELVLAAYRRASESPVRPKPNLDQRYSTRYICDLSRRLSRKEVELITRATTLREEGLEKARLGLMAEARELLTEARRVIEEEIESHEGRISSRSFQAAADAFVEHVRNHHSTARELLLESLQLCRTLRVKYGYVVEIRRVHLARNIARVIWCLGHHQESLTLSVNLLLYLWSSPPIWPLSSSTDVQMEDRDPVRSDERLFLTDQVLSEAVSTTIDARSTDVQLSIEPTLVWAIQNSAAPAIISSVLTLCIESSARGSTELHNCFASYFELMPKDMELTWRKVTSLLEDIMGSQLEA